jgi:hypothetical protein
MFSLVAEGLNELSIEQVDTLLTYVTGSSEILNLNLEHNFRYLD